MAKQGKFIDKETGQEIVVHFPASIVDVVTGGNKTIVLSTFLTNLLETISVLDTKIKQLEAQIGQGGPGGDGSGGGSGISDIHFTNDNVFVFELTDGNEIECPINVEAVQSLLLTSTSQVTSVGSGTLTQAIAHANDDNLNVHFQWLLIDEDNEGNEVKKLIWHIGSGTFIDAFGCPIQQTS